MKTLGLLSKQHLLAAGLLLSACNPGDFSSLADETWVDSSGKPDGLDSGDFGAGVAFGGSGGPGLSFVAVARTPPGFSQFQYAANGDKDTESKLIKDGLVGSEVPNVNQLSERPAIAGDPDNFGKTTGNIALGVTDGEKGYVSLIKASDNSIGLIDLALDGAPTSLTFGSGAEVDGEADLWAAEGTTLSLIANYQSSTLISSCQTSSAIVGLLAADLNGDGDSEILVAGGGEVQIFAASSILGMEGAACPVPLDSIAGPGMGFGSAMTTGDFDGNGDLDLAIGAPAQNSVKVFMNGSLASEQTVDAPSGSAAFGDALAAGDFNDDGADELVVADSQASPEDTSNAGSVYLVHGNNLSIAATLYDAEPESQQRFGRCVTVAKFGDSKPVLVVGARNEIMVYFRNPLSGSDVRER